ncbi:MAG: hypothetical protein NTY15_20470 [Planctomycetota bacterium]|nr:hypothetical protein [Planctomycetota bacterium]
MSDELETVQKPQRRGDVGKCPACGSSVDPEAYHCPTCQTDFCFHCRARLLPADVQLECVSQPCSYYGKLICSICDGKVEQEEPPILYNEPQDGYWPAWLALVLFLAGIIWYLSSSFLAAAIISVTVYFGAGYYLQKQLDWNLFGKERSVEQHRRTSFYRCIHCQGRAKELRKESLIQRGF